MPLLAPARTISIETSWKQIAYAPIVIYIKPPKTGFRNNYSENHATVLYRLRCYTRYIDLGKFTLLLATKGEQKID